MSKYSWILAIILILIFSFFIHGRLLGKVADADSFYHIRHSWIYRTGGLLQTAFPWVQYSSINKYSADIWYGFHILITPFTYFGDLLTGLNAGAIFITAFSLLLVYFALIRLRVKWPVFWLFLFALASADLLYRLAMLRPHPISLGLSLLLFAYLQKQSENESNKKTLIILFLISTAFSWIHLSLTWMPVLIVLTTLLLEVLQKQGLDWKKPLAVIAGLITGLLLRPNPFGAAKLAYIQVVQLLLQKQSEIPLRFGRELTPFTIENFLDQLIPISLFLILAIGLTIWVLRKKDSSSLLSANIKTSIIGSLTLCFIFFVLTFAVARRSNEVFIGFAIIFLALVFTHLLRFVSRKSWQFNFSVVAIAVSLVYMPLKNIYRFDTFVENAFEPHGFEDVAAWLKTNSQPKEIVFNIHWDRFPQLFFWDQKNYYINGMDPIFEYSFNHSLYWKTHFFAIDAATAFTCGQIRCTAEEVEKTPEVLKRDFHASYIMVEKRRNPKLYGYLQTASEFRKVFENDSEILFKVL